MEPIRVSDPGTFVAVTEQAMGFFPTDSVIAVYLSGGQVTLSARVGMPTAEEHALDMAKALVRPVATGRTHADHVLLIGYSDTIDPETPLRVAGIFFETFDVQVRDAIVVQHRRWRSLHCQDPTCCPDEGTPIPTAGGALDAISAHLGGQVRRSRADLESLLMADPALAAPVDEAPEGVDLDYCVGTLPLWTMVANDTVLDVRPADVARLAHSCDHLGFRDGVVAAVGGRVPLTVLPEQVQQVVRPLAAVAATRERGPIIRAGVQAVASLIPDQPETVNLLATLGNLAWYCGDGATAQILLDRALTIDPDHRLSRLTSRMLELGVSPASVSSPPIPGP